MEYRTYREVTSFEVLDHAHQGLLLAARETVASCLVCHVDVGLVILCGRVNQYEIGVWIAGVCAAVSCENV